jgi:hypothetical protein
VRQRKGADLEPVSGKRPLAGPVPSEVAIGRLDLVPPPRSRLEPTTKFRKGGEPLGMQRANVLGFWSWAFSDLRQNNIRGHLAEYIVGLALECLPDS